MGLGNVKSMAEIRDAEAEKHCSFIKGPCDFEQRIFKAGFDCRDKLDNESLKIAVEALECVFKNSNANRGDWHGCREALEEIRKIRGGG